MGGILWSSPEPEEPKRAPTQEVGVQWEDPRGQPQPGASQLPATGRQGHKRPREEDTTTPEDTAQGAAQGSTEVPKAPVTKGREEPPLDHEPKQVPQAPLIRSLFWGWIIRVIKWVLGLGMGFGILFGIFHLAPVVSLKPQENCLSLIFVLLWFQAKYKIFRNHGSNQGPPPNSAKSVLRPPPSWGPGLEHGKQRCFSSLSKIFRKSKIF